MVVEVMNVYVALDLLAKAVREAREERGLSQRELARKLSMNTRTIMDLEICRSNPKGETIFLIARELHISLDAIAHAGTSRPNSVNADVLEFFSGKENEEKERSVTEKWGLHPASFLLQKIKRRRQRTW